MAAPAGAERDRLFAERTEVLAAETRLERAMRRYDCALRIALKAGYRPDQPRVPKGNSDGGQWTAEGGGSGDPKPGKEASSDKPAKFG